MRRSVENHAILAIHLGKVVFWKQGWAKIQVTNSAFGLAGATRCGESVAFFGIEERSGDIGKELLANGYGLRHRAPKHIGTTFRLPQERFFQSA